MQTCVFAADNSNSAWDPCTGSTAGARDCTSSLDNDCDGTADNLSSSCVCLPVGGTQSCSTGLYGICAAGTQTCALSGDRSATAWGTCNQTTLAAVETCGNPGVDDDCDGIVDDIPVAPCNVGTGLGACLNGGTTGCNGVTQVCLQAVTGLEDPSVWGSSAAPNGSWDWDCDGKVTREFVTPCASRTTQGTCLHSGESFGLYWVYAGTYSCDTIIGGTFTECTWDGSSCQQGSTIDGTWSQGCH